MSHFTTLERDRDFHLAAVIQELHALINFVAVIMIRDIQTELDLFDFLGLLILFLIFQLLFLLVAEFSEVHDSAYGRFACFCNQDKIKPGVLCRLTRRNQSHQTKLFPIRADDKQILVCVCPTISFQQLTNSCTLQLEFIFSEKIVHKL